jgi:thiopurine S-methyltransferase
MEKNFWHERWQRQEIGFHQNEINTYLIRHWQALHPARGAQVFVPLCGKSRDMLWLREQGHPVLGVELSAIAVQAFFTENGCQPSRASCGNLERYEADGIRILCGDFFDLTKDDLKDVGAVYDRASLVALPPEMRARYVRHLLDILPPTTQMLLLTFDYQQPEMSGPPFAVSVGEVEALYRGRAKISLLAQLDALDSNPRFRERGLSRLQENVFLLNLNP